MPYVRAAAFRLARGDVCVCGVRGGVVKWPWWRLFKIPFINMSVLAPRLSVYATARVKKRSVASYFSGHLQSLCPRQLVLQQRRLAAVKLAQVGSMWIEIPGQVISTVDLFSI